MNQLKKIIDGLRQAIDPYRERVLVAIRPYLAQLRSRYDKLESRERRLVQIAGAVFAIFLIYDFIYLPIANWQESLSNTVATRRREIGDVQHLVDTYVQRKTQLREAEKNTVPIGKDFSLFSVIEKSLTQSVGHDKIASITPGSDSKLSDGFTQYSVECKLQNVSLAQVVDALYGVKTLSAPVAVSNLRIQRRTPDVHSYDVELTCIALAKSG
jgi:type II secretory pathway component PulM